MITLIENFKESFFSRLDDFKGNERTVAKKYFGGSAIIIFTAMNSCIVELLDILSMEYKQLKCRFLKV